MVRTVALTVALLGLACQGKSSAPPPTKTKAAKAAEPVDAKADSADAKVAADPSKAGPAPVNADNPDLGMRFSDPPWFRKELFPKAKSAKASRSEADNNGLFSSQILFELEDGTTMEQCVDHLVEKIEPHVPGLKRTPEPDKNRYKVTGELDRYGVTLMCGEAKGVMRAYVAFQWYK